MDGVPGEDLEFLTVLSAYDHDLANIHCQNLSLQSDVFAVPSPNDLESGLCVSFADFDHDDGLLPVLATNTGMGAVNVGHLSFSFVIETDNIMDPPKMTNFAHSPAEQSIEPIAGTDNWRGYVRFDESSGIVVPGQDELRLFDIEIMGPSTNLLRQAPTFASRRPDTHRQRLQDCLPAARLRQGRVRRGRALPTASSRSSSGRRKRTAPVANWA
ncbi:MAG: hypothetical protein KIS77_19890 [Saprospiraceae bacterium]|nr:hypothetical protein [Saprospiraceae bacterium]